MSKFILTALIALYLTSCRTTPLISSSDKKEEIKDFALQQINFQYLSAKAKMNFKDSDHDINATLNIRIRKDSLIWMSLVPAMGIEATRCLITKDSIFLLDRLANQYHEYDFNSLGEKININLNYSIFESMLLGNLPFPKTSADSLTFLGKEGYFLLTQEKDKLRVYNYIKKETMKLERIQLKENRSHKDLQIVYNNFAPLNEFLFAYSSLINFTYPKNQGIQSSSVTIQYNKVEFPDKPLNFPFNVPPKYTRQH